MIRAAIAVDARMIQSSGIGTYLQGLLKGLSPRVSPYFSLHLLGNPAQMPQGPWTVSPANASIYSLREQWEIPRAFRRSGAMILHSPHYNLPVVMASKTVVTVHDLIHLKFPQYWPSMAARAYARFFFYHVVPKAQAILTVSENTKRDLINMLSIPENRITVTYNAVDHERFARANPLCEEAFKQLGLPSEYFLYIGNMKEFKNVERLVQAYRELQNRRKDCPVLVLVGRNFIPGFDHIISKTLGVRWLGKISRDLLPSLYQNALAFLFPSLYEGFGLPPLEAMASGTPVMCSNSASLPEVVGNAALLINPESTDDMISAMERLIEDSALRKELSAKGLKQAAQFSWERMANQTLQIYQQCLD